MSGLVWQGLRAVDGRVPVRRETGLPDRVRDARPILRAVQLTALAAVLVGCSPLQVTEIRQVGTTWRIEQTQAGPPTWLVFLPMMQKEPVVIVDDYACKYKTTRPVPGCI
jgi:hypothetical protein